MSSVTRTIYPSRLNEDFNLKFPLGYSDGHAPNEGWRAQRPIRFGNSNKVGDNSSRANNVNNLTGYYFCNEFNFHSTLMVFCRTKLNVAKVDTISNYTFVREETIKLNFRLHFFLGGYMSWGCKLHMIRNTSKTVLSVDELT